MFITFWHKLVWVIFSTWLVFKWSTESGFEFLGKFWWWRGTFCRYIEVWHLHRVMFGSNPVFFRFVSFKLVIFSFIDLTSRRSLIKLFSRSSFRSPSRFTSRSTLRLASWLTPHIYFISFIIYCWLHRFTSIDSSSRAKFFFRDSDMFARTLAALNWYSFVVLLGILLI